MELIRDRAVRAEMETEALEDSQVRADRVKTIAADSRDLDHKRTQFFRKRGK